MGQDRIAAANERHWERMVAEGSWEHWLAGVHGLNAVVAKKEQEGA